MKAKVKEKGNSPFFTPEEVAERYRVDFTTVHRWIRNGWLSALDLGCGKRFGPYLITQKDLDEFEDRRHREATVEKVPPLGLETEEELPWSLDGEYAPSVPVVDIVNRQRALRMLL